MTEKLFFSQELINSWCDDQRVKFENDVLSIHTRSGLQEYHLTPAYRVLRVADDTPDHLNIVDRVLEKEELEQKGADIYLNSAIIGETPYDVEPGYVAVKAEDERSLEDLLMEYLLKTLK